MNIVKFNQPTELETRIAVAEMAERPATAEEIRLAAASSADLLAEKRGRVKEAADPKLQLKRQLGRYAALTRPKMSATKVFKCRIELEKGVDPLLLAVHFNAEFSSVMRIANDVLRVRCEQEGRPVIRFPETIPGYLKIVFEHERRTAETVATAAAAAVSACNPPALESDLAQKDTNRHV